MKINMKILFCSMLYSGTRVKMNYDIFFLMIYVSQIIYDSYLLHVYISMYQIFSMCLDKYP